ncbi:long-chain fatty acid--CoA ligase [Pendulispora albinea]|uniref:Acyl-protein synthetase LuxE domain-containing protein n=1 Tax=Pendulispora albinea TaxID=2741071 RepID=A0ABZ2LKS7_9BACT
MCARTWLLSRGGPAHDGPARPSGPAAQHNCHQIKPRIFNTIQKRHPVSFSFTLEKIRPSGTLDAVIFDESTCFDLSLRAQRQLRSAFVAETFAFHLERCTAYRAFAERRGGPDILERVYLDIDAVPVYPTAAFKRWRNFAVEDGAVEKWCLSSGTRGTRSEVPRDRVTLERLLGSVKAAMPLVHDWYEHEATVINLGPSRAEAGDIWFGYVMSLIELLYPTTCMVREATLLVDEAIERLRSSVERGQDVILVGPPFLLLELADAVTSKNVRIDSKDRLTTITAGGWKRFSGTAIDRAQLEERLATAFGMSDRTRMRDAFNQVELNAVLMECRAGWKHVPPWVHATTRDPHRLHVQPRGEMGLMSYLDASATSYPCFIVSDDVGVTREGMCECGREGVTVRIVRRTRTSAQRGCALSIDRTLQEVSHAR